MLLQTIKHENLKKSGILAMLLLGNFTLALAQDNVISHSSSTQTHTTTSVGNNMDWLYNPYIWGAAGVLLLIIIIGLVTRKAGNTTHEVRRTVTTRTEVSDN